MVGKFVTISHNHESSCVSNFNGVWDPIGKQRILVKALASKNQKM
jgi:hypothetical protein